MSKQQNTETSEHRTIRGRVIAVRTFEYEKDNETRPAGELVVITAGSGDKFYVTLFGDALGHCDGWWLNEQTWAYEVGPVVEPGQWVQAYGVYSEKEWQSEKWGLVIQPKLATFDPNDLKLMPAPIRPGHKPAKPSKPARPKAV
ncbi:hypothetical protein N9934_05805, partial [Desulfosarcina sp.]|nr:hypothetical protein [Desulfosarcina sp.]